ncbi:MAG: diguanylate cyclase, partial [Chloroflexi bacterium]|nr:diguanylate cyclase [Chloroflexota bacterium]
MLDEARSPVPATRPGAEMARPGPVWTALRGLARDALLDDAPARVFPSRVAMLAALAATVAFVAASLAMAGAEAAASFALVPLVLAAVLLAAVPAAAVAAVTIAASVAPGWLLPSAAPMEGLELVKLGAICLVALCLRVVVVRNVHARETLQARERDLVRARGEAESSRDTTERWVAQLETVQRAAARMARQPSVEAIAGAVVDELRAIVDYHNCRVYLVEPPDDLVPVCAAGRTGEYEDIALELFRTKVGQGLSGWVAQHGEAVLVGDALADGRGVTVPGTDDVDESMVVVPMRYDERVIGVVTLSKLGLDQFDGGHLRLVSILADHAATAVESARALARARSVTGELEQLVEMSRALAGSLDPRRVADLIAAHMGAALGADLAVISYWDRENDRLLTWGYWPSTSGDDRGPYYPLDRYPATRRVLQTQATEIVDVEDPAADAAERELLAEDGFRSLAMIPLVAKGVTIGLVEVMSRGLFAFDAHRSALARTMANEAAMALGNAQLYETARALADRDPLSGFYNHRAFHERLGEEIVRARRSRRPVSLLMVDLDDFKLVNDTFGHQYGDRVLAWVAEQIRSTLRASDVPARYGGDEFAVVLPETDRAEACQAAERILEVFRLRAFRDASHGPVPIGASIGVAAFPADGESPRALVGAADRACYRAKR